MSCVHNPTFISYAQVHRCVLCTTPSCIQIGAVSYDRQGVADHAANLASTIQGNLKRSLEAMGVVCGVVYVEYVYGRWGGWVGIWHCCCYGCAPSVVMVVNQVDTAAAACMDSILHLLYCNTSRSVLYNTQTVATNTRVL